MKPVIRHEQKKQGHDRKTVTDPLKNIIMEQNRSQFLPKQQREDIKKQQDPKSNEHQQTFFAETKQKSVFLIRGNFEKRKCAEYCDRNNRKKRQDKCSLV